MICLRNKIILLVAVFGIYDSNAYAENHVVFEPIYSAQGNLKYQHITESNQTNFEQDWRFGVQEDTVGKWKIELHTQLPITRMPLRANEYISYDGTNIYSILYSPDKVVTSRDGPATLIAGDNQHAARVSVGPYPVDYTSVGGVLWLAFIGGRYLDTTSSQMKFPDLTVADPRRDPAAWSCDFRYDLVKSAVRSMIYSGRFVLNKKYLPHSSSEYYQIDDPNDETEFEQRERLLNQFQALSADILVRATYTVDETNSFQGVVIPMRFHSDVYSLDHSTAHNHIEVIVTNSAAFGTTDLLPHLEGLVTVTDQRMRVKDANLWRRAVIYNLDKNGWITDTNDPRIVFAAAKRPPDRRILFTNRPVFYRWSVIFFGLILLSPILVFVFRRKH